MTAEEIRKIRYSDISEDVNFHILCEIAAQLADLNEHFRQVDANVFGTPVPKDLMRKT